MGEMRSWSRLDDLDLRITAIRVLRILKRNSTYRELEKELSVPLVSLNRYVRGNSLPERSVAERILQEYYGGIESVIRRAIGGYKGEDGFFVTHPLITDPDILTLISREVKQLFPERVTRVVTAASDGIPLALKVAEVYGCTFAFAKGVKEIGFDKFYVAERKSDITPVISPLYLPKQFLGRRDSVLLVDDVVRTGTTQMALVGIVSQAKARLVGCFSIFATRSGLERLKEAGVNAKAIITE